jgi:hypothetical protein
MLLVLVLFLFALFVVVLVLCLTHVFAAEGVHAHPPTVPQLPVMAASSSRVDASVGFRPPTVATGAKPALSRLMPKSQIFTWAEKQRARSSCQQQQ